MTSTGDPPSVSLPRPGDTIAGKYVLDRLLGQGGMGAVYAARHLKLSKQVAIKIMLADTSNPEASTRFINEGRAAANIQNEHVVRVDDVGDEMGYAYMVLELLDGEDLSQLLERDPAHRLQPHVAVGYVLQALKGVTEAHAIGIVHRDLKPSNLFLAQRKDGTVVVKVLDFGISKAQGSSALAASPSALTSTKAMLGSPLYMSPEQLRSSKSVDHRADIWAVGVILYELISGTLPFMGDNLGELFAAILETDPTPLRQRAEGVHPQLDDIVLRCLARRPDQRFQNVAELAAALAPFAAPVVGWQPVPHTLIQPSHPGSLPGGNITPNGPVSSPVSLGSPNQGPRGSGSTVAIGTNTPAAGNLQVTTGGWQSTGGGGRANVPPPTSKGLAIALVATVTCAAIVIALLLLKPWKTSVQATAGSSGVATTSSPPSPAPVAPPATSLAAEPAPQPPASASAHPAETSSPAPTAPSKPASTGHTRPSTPAVPVVAKPAEPKAPEPKATGETPKPAASATSKPASTAGSMQNSR